MRNAFLIATAIASATGMSLLTGGVSASATQKTPVTTATAWGCVARDNGAQNPGPSCPKDNGYTYPGITNSSGYNTFIDNDMWNPPGAGNPQTIYANSPAVWEVVANMPKGNGAVLSYPDVQQVFTQSDNAPAALSGFQALFSDFRESMPHTGDNEAAYDIWLGTSQATDYSQEVMIWVDDHRTDQPPGTIVAKPSFYGVPYTVWDSDGTIFMVRNRSEASGRIHILAMLDWLMSHRLSPPHSGVNQVDFGWELCSTNGKPQTFTMSAYDLRSGCVKKGTACWSS